MRAAHAAALAADVEQVYASGFDVATADIRSIPALAELAEVYVGEAETFDHIGAIRVLLEDALGEVPPLRRRRRPRKYVKGMKLLLGLEGATVWQAGKEIKLDPPGGIGARQEIAADPLGYGSADSLRRSPKVDPVTKKKGLSLDWFKTLLVGGLLALVEKESLLYADGFSHSADEPERVRTPEVDAEPIGGTDEEVSVVPGSSVAARTDVVPEQEIVAHVGLVPAQEVKPVVELEAKTATTLVAIEPLEVVKGGSESLRELDAVRPAEPHVDKADDQGVLQPARPILLLGEGLPDAVEEAEVSLGDSNGDEARLVVTEPPEVVEGGPQAPPEPNAKRFVRPEDYVGRSSSIPGRFKPPVVHGEEKYVPPKIVNDQKSEYRAAVLADVLRKRSTKRARPRPTLPDTPYVAAHRSVDKHLAFQRTVERWPKTSAPVLRVLISVDRVLEWVTAPKNRPIWDWAGVIIISAAVGLPLGLVLVPILVELAQSL